MPFTSEFIQLEQYVLPKSVGCFIKKESIDFI